MTNMQTSIGIVTYSHPPVYPTTPQREEYVKNEYRKLYDLLENNGFSVEAPLFELRKDNNYSRFGIGDASDLQYCISYLKSRDIKCLVVQLNQWTRISLASDIIKVLDVPSALYANSDGVYPGEVTSSAVAASVLEVPKSGNCLLLERFRDTENEMFISWIKGVMALQKMRQSRVIAWGGYYGADIPYTRDDDAMLENIFVKEIIPEQEMVLIEKARQIVKNQPGRIEGFINWLKENGAKINYDGKMLTEDVLKFQAGQYFAAKDRLAELDKENIEGVTIKCHFEVSTDCVGCTECLIPAFMPFGTDSEGARSQVPVGCEGDLKGLLTSMMMSAIKPDTPPLFGDVITYTSEYVLISNCGSASVYWAARSNQPQNTLQHVKLIPQVHGKSGSAVYYFTPEKPENTVTYARLFRLNRKYFMYLGTGKITQAGGNHGRTWPVTKVRFGADPYLLFKTSPANHGCLTEGDITSEIEAFCRQAGIEVVRCDNDKSLKNYINTVFQI